MADSFSCDPCFLLLLLAISIFTLFVAWLFLRSFLPKPKIKDFHKKYVLITGCDSGFGRRTAILLDELGFNVIATCLTTQGKEGLQEVCSSRLIAALMDVTDSEQIRNFYDEVKKIIPSEEGLWAVVNNAGYMTLAPLEWFKLEDYKKMADTNLWGLIDVTKTFLPLLKKAKGRIVNFGSIAGLVSPATFAPYSITKYGVEAFSDALRREMVHWGVKVCIMEPQAFQTLLLHELTGKKLVSLWDGISDDMKKEYGEEYLEHCKRYLVEGVFKKSSKNIDLVVNDVIDALTSRDPRPRYLIGRQAKIVGFFSLLPTVVQDYIFKPIM
ncbi:dehydrogenase/reductase SDR family member 9-like [Actinia tenebrosa]|uniref:Dehydrogenase/reductase SDR family member 9-like n=1 Tax=Actinia tenebrosa TaxID=6105 RepID=A0A6P8IPQ8_ACTTE|nr:dehydrogenase/reductase SDR family member 9-like [Actinia tenebrosa]